MKDRSSSPAKVTTPSETIARLASPRLFVSEKAEDYAALRAALFAELAPRTPYESSLAENLVRYEWEMARLRDFRDKAILAEFRDLALNALMTWSPTGYFSEGTAREDDYLLIRDLASPDPKTRAEAEAEYCARCNWHPSDLLGLAYTRASGVAQLEDRVADLERRRRVLRADYAALKAAIASASAEEAKLVEESP